MKLFNKILQFLLGFIIGSILFHGTTLAATGYNRLPAGQSITAPVSIIINADTMADLGCPLSLEGWNIVIGSNSGNYFGPTHATGVLSTNDNFNLPVGTEVTQVHTLGPACGVMLEGNGSDVIFTITASTNNIITVPPYAANTVLSYPARLFTDIWPLLLVALGIPIAFYVVNKVKDIMKPPRTSFTSGSELIGAGYDKHGDKFYVRKKGRKKYRSPV